MPVRVLLNGISRQEVYQQPTIPKLVRDVRLQDTEEEYAVDLLNRVPKERQALERPHGLCCRVCLYIGERGIPAADKLIERLANLDVGLSFWNETSHVADFDAAVVILDDPPSIVWNARGISFLEDCIKCGKPLPFVSLPGARPPLKALGRLQPTASIEYNESDNLAFLQLLWAIVGYRRCDLGSEAGVVEDKLPKQTAARRPESNISQPLRVFISYSHEDESLRRKLETNLSMLRRQGVIDVWSDHKITPGEEWTGKIDESLESAEIILLLVSANFIASDYCYDAEMTRALERHKAGRVKVIPIILRDVDWSSAPFANLQALPKGSKPVKLWNKADTAWRDVAEGIRAVAEQIRPSSL